MAKKSEIKEILDYSAKLIKKLALQTRKWLKEHIRDLPPVPTLISIGIISTMIYCLFNFIAGLVIAIIAIIAILIMPLVEKLIDRKIAGLGWISPRRFRKIVSKRKFKKK